MAALPFCACFDAPLIFVRLPAKHSGFQCPSSALWCYWLVSFFVAKSAARCKEHDCIPAYWEASWFIGSCSAASDSVLKNVALPCASDGCLGISCTSANLLRASDLSSNICDSSCVSPETSLDFRMVKSANFLTWQLGNASSHVSRTVVQLGDFCSSSCCKTLCSRNCTSVPCLGA